MADKLEDIDLLFSDFQERHDGKPEDYLLTAKKIMEGNQ